MWTAHKSRVGGQDPLGEGGQTPAYLNEYVRQLDLTSGPGGGERGNNGNSGWARDFGSLSPLGLDLK